MKANRSGSQQPQAAASDGVRLIVFDFDQTLSVVHVFKTLAGWSKDAHFQVPRPHATTERGQVRRISEISLLEPYKSERGGFATVAFGGEARIDQLRDMLERLQARDVNLVICTKGLVGAVRKCLSDIGLLSFFSEVYGNVGNNYGETTYDQDLARSRPTTRERQFLSAPDRGAWKSKDKLVFQLASRAGLSRDQAVLVEDDAEEIRRANGICRTMWVKEAAGMTSRHINGLLQLVEGGRQPGSRGEDMPFARSSDSRISGISGRFEARHRDVSSRDRETESAHRKFERPAEEAPGNASMMSEGNSRLEGSSRMELEFSRLSLDDDCRPAQLPPVTQGRRSKPCVDSVSKASRPPARPSSRGNHSRRSALQAAGSRLLT